MAKKPTVTTLASGFNSTEALNANFEALRDSFDNTLSLDGSTPNALGVDLDLNNNNIINANAIMVGGSDVVTTTAAALAAAVQAQIDADAAVVASALSETNAANSATASQTSANASQASRLAAEVAETNAELAETNAEIAEVNAETSATNSAGSANASLASQVAASGSASAALASQVDANTSQGNASVSALAASSSETAAALSESNAATSETNAATSETNSAASATASANSATASANSAIDATNNGAAQLALNVAQVALANTARTGAELAETNAATSETNAAVSETNAAASETEATAQAVIATTKAAEAAASAASVVTDEAATAAFAAASASSATDSANSAAAAAASLDNFDDRYLGSKTTEPTLDNDGNALISGALYFSSTVNAMQVYDGANWIAASAAGVASMILYEYTATAGQTTFTGSDDNGRSISFIQGNEIVVLNGIILDPSDYNSTSGVSIVLTVAAGATDVLNVYAFKSFTVADTVSASAGGTFGGDVTVTGTLAATTLTGDGSAITGLPAGYTDTDVATYLAGTSPTVGGLTTTADVSFGDNDKAIFGAGSDLQIYHDGSNSYIYEGGTGSLKIQAVNLNLQSTTGESYIDAVNNGSVYIYHDNAAKLATTSTGIDVTGTVTADGLTVDHNTALYQVDKTLSSYSSQNGVYLNGNGYGWLAMAGDGTQRTNIRVHGQNSSSGELITFQTADSERMSISSSGSVNIVGSASGTEQFRVGNSSGGTDFGITVTENSGVVLNSAEGSSARSMGFSTGGGNPKMTLDPSGNLLVGGTVAFGADTITLGTGGFAGIRNTSSSCLELRRDTTDGAILDFQKDGTTVGSINVGAGNVLAIGQGSNYIQFHDSLNNFYPSNGNGGRDNAMDIGASGVRFKDLYLSGTANAANFNTTSDATLKTNVETLTGSLDAVKSLRGVSYDWIENGGSEIGVIAQEVEAVLPDVVSTNDEGIKSVKYGNMVAVLIEAIKEQQLRIEALETKLNS